MGELVLSSEPRRIRGVLTVLRGVKRKRRTKAKVRRQESAGGPSGRRVAETEGRNVSVGSKAKLRVRT